MKKNEGITLIALIITVIVMLVLVAVSIRMIVNSDILKTTQDATKEYELAKVKDDLETELANITIDKKYKNKGTTKTYYEYLVEKYGAENVKEIITGTRYTITYQGYEIDVSVNEYDEIKLANALEIKWLYEDNDDGTINITGMDLSDYSGLIVEENWYRNIEIDVENDTLLIPEEISGKKVVKFSLDDILPTGAEDEFDIAIGGCKKIIFPNSIKTIEDLSDVSWTDVTEIKLGENLETIGYGSFYRCHKLNALEIPASVVNFTGAFCGCSAKTITFKGNITAICNDAFKRSCIKNFIVPASVETIGGYAFAYCRASTISFAGDVDEFGDFAFMGADISSITIPESINKIPMGAFAHCENLSEITFKRNH